MFELVISLGIGGAAAVVIGAIAFGVVAQVIGEPQMGFEWLIDAIAVAIGAVIASEFIVAWQAAGPMWDGLALLPALLGGLVVGLIVEVATRTLTGGTYTSRDMPA